MFEKMRHTWLTVSAIALFWLPGPFCVLACLEDAQSAAPAALADEMPCHEQGPSEPSDLGHDCDCSTASVPALLAFDAPAQMAGVVLRVPAHRAIARTDLLEPFVPRVERIPPPDILLQKSTLVV